MPRPSRLATTSSGGYIHSQGTQWATGHDSHHGPWAAQAQTPSDQQASRTRPSAHRPGGLVHADMSQLSNRTRRLFLQVATLPVGAMALSACGGGSDAPTPPAGG